MKLVECLLGCRVGGWRRVVERGRVEAELLTGGTELLIGGGRRVVEQSRFLAWDPYLGSGSPSGHVALWQCPNCLAVCQPLEHTEEALTAV